MRKFSTDPVFTYFIWICTSCGKPCEVENPAEKTNDAFRKENERVNGPDILLPERSATKKKPTKEKIDTLIQVLKDNGEFPQDLPKKKPSEFERGYLAAIECFEEHLKVGSPLSVAIASARMCYPLDEQAR